VQGQEERQESSNRAKRAFVMDPVYIESLAAKTPPRPSTNRTLVPGPTKANPIQPRTGPPELRPSFTRATAVGKRGSCILFRQRWPHCLMLEHRTTMKGERAGRCRYIQAMLGHAKLTNNGNHTQSRSGKTASNSKRKLNATPPPSHDRREPGPRRR